MQIKYLGHSCFLINTLNTSILFDPFISHNPLNSGFDVSSIKADFILISHAHQDHLADALTIAQKNNSKIIAIWEICEWFLKQGYDNSHPMNIGGVKEFEFGQLQLTNAVHSSTFPDGTYGGQAAGFVIKNNDKTFYYAGDTALTMDMKLIPERYVLDFAFLPIGSNFTMDYIDAIKCSEFINCTNIIGMHFDTFGFIEIDKNFIKNQFENNNKKLTLLNINEEINI